MGVQSGKPLDDLRGVPGDFPEVAGKDSHFEVAGCKHLTYFSISEIYEILTRDALTGSKAVTNLSYLDYLGKEFVGTLQLLRLQAVERVIIGFD